MIVKNKIQLSLITFIASIIILIFFGIRPLFLGIEKNSEELISQKQTLASFETKIENLERFKEISQEIEPDVQKLSTFFVKSDVPVDFINFLEKTAQECQLQIDISSAVPGGSKDDPWSYLIFQITSQGSFQNFLRFLEKLETSPYLIEAQNLNINRITKESVYSKESAEISLGDINVRLSIKVLTKSD